MPITALTSLRVDFDFSNSCYVLKLASNSAHSTENQVVAAALSNNIIKVYQQTAADLRHVVDLKGHAGTITDICLPLSSSPQLIASSSSDGSVRTWDGKSPSCCERYDTADEEVYACSCSDNVAVAGGDGAIHFWDRRTRQKLVSLEDTHMDMVTITRFHPVNGALLFTASDDGLMAIFDFTNGINEDDAFVAGQNISNSPLELGFYGKALDKLWCRSASETLHLWHWAQAVTDDDNPGDVANVLDARELLTQAAGPRLPSIGAQVDLLVGCHYEALEDQLFVAAGSNDGPLALFPVGPPRCSGLFGEPTAFLTNVHTELVRTALFQGDLVITGGEDARLCVWGDADALELKMAAALSHPPAARASLMTDSARHKPY